MLRRTLFTSVFCLLAFHQALHAQGSIDEARAVLQREMPALTTQIHLSLAAGDYAGKPDGFRVSGQKGNIRVEAATVPTLLYGVNWYLKYVAHLNISTNGGQLGAPGLRLPEIPVAIVKPALYPFRYALNENTDGYTTPYWDLPRWQHEIDILALSGFNAILIQRGNDLAVYQAFLDVGYKDEDIRKWITYPAHQNWEWMGNMCCFIEPISLDLMKKRAASARQIMDELRKLGMMPVLPGFYGVVPADFSKHVAGAHVVIQTDPWNGFERPGWLDPRDPAFTRLAAAFYRRQHELFGDSTLYDMETFQEGGMSGDVPIGDGAKAIQKALNTAHPDALWFMMAWQDNPRKELVDAVDRSRILIADIEQGRIPRESREADFEGARWLYGGLWEFGGRTTMGAPLYDYAQRMPPMAKQPGSHISGTALFTEGLDTNPYAFDLYTEMAWRSDVVDLAEWTKAYSLRRYGKNDIHAQNAWQIVGKTVYGYRADGVKDHGERDAAHESIFNAQPSLTATRTGHWAPDVLRYDAEALKPALTELLQVAPALRTTASYHYDLVDVTRQVLTNDARRLLPLIKAAYEAKDRGALRLLTAEWLHDMAMEDRLLATNQYFLLGKWLEYVPAWASTPKDLERTEYDAHSILTTWGDRTASESLHEYGNKDWAGLVSGYYAPRWKLYFASLEASLNTGTPSKPIDWYAFGDTWNRSTKHYDSTPIGDPYAVSMEIARSLQLQPKDGR
ncbi:alpha-N-acetylglucosaminidase [Granulicella arctica]|uniref:alpha-N-acetylglucosaminidase n=1 Tax=Granulicella arctica TaxID=940613 RepID=UPI0021E03529|nr:alpha-N-acetylglucosaminidase [Granulicella arctica]